MSAPKKNPQAAALARRRSRSLSPERRSEIARSAARARWKKHGKKRVRA